MKTQLDNWNEGVTRGIDKFIEYEGTHAYPEGNVVAFLGGDDLREVLVWKSKKEHKIYERKGTNRLPIAPFKLLYPFKQNRTTPVVAINYVLSYIGLSELLVIGDNMQDLIEHVSIKGNLLNSFYPLSNPTPEAKKIIEQYDTLESYLSRGTSSVVDSIVDAVGILGLPLPDISGIREGTSLKDMQGAFYAANFRNMLNIYLNVGACGFMGHPLILNNIEEVRPLATDINNVSVIRSKVIRDIEEGMINSYPMFPIQGIVSLNISAFPCLQDSPPPDPFSLALGMGTTLSGLLGGMGIYQTYASRVTTEVYNIYLLQTVKAAVKCNVMTNIAANITDYVVATPTHWYNLMGYGAPYLNIMSQNGYAIIGMIDVHNTTTFASPLVKIVNSTKKTTTLTTESKLPNSDKLFTRVNLTFTDELIMMDSFVGVKCVFDSVEEEGDTGQLTATRIYPGIFLMNFMCSDNKAGEEECKKVEMTEEDGRIGVAKDQIKGNKWKLTTNAVKFIGTHANFTTDDTYALYEDINSPYFLSQCFMEMRENVFTYIKEGYIPRTCPITANIVFPTSVSVGVDLIKDLYFSIITQLINKINATKSTSNLNVSYYCDVDVPFCVNVVIDESEETIKHIGMTRSINVITPENCENSFYDYKGRYSLFRKFANETCKQVLLVYVASVNANIDIRSVDLITPDGFALSAPFNQVRIAEEHNPYKFLTEGLKVAVKVKGGGEDEYTLRPHYTLNINPTNTSLIGWWEHEGRICFPKCYSTSSDTIFTYSSDGVLLFRIREEGDKQFVDCIEHDWLDVLGITYKPSVVGNFEEFIKLVGGMFV